MFIDLYGPTDNGSRDFITLPCVCVLCLLHLLIRSTYWDTELYRKLYFASVYEYRQYSNFPP